MGRYKLAIGGSAIPASELIAEAGIGGIPKSLELIGGITIGGVPAAEVELEWFQLKPEVTEGDVIIEMEKRGLEPPTLEMSIQSAGIIPVEVLQLGDVVFPHIPILISTNGEMAEYRITGNETDCLITLGLVEGTGQRQFILKVTRSIWPAGTIFVGAAAA